MWKSSIMMQSRDSPTIKNEVAKVEYVLATIMYIRISEVINLLNMLHLRAPSIKL